MTVTTKRTSSETYELNITASTTQTQGNGSLTAKINVITTVANPNDTTTLPLAELGDKIGIINKGANTLQIFPALGDDLGNGVNIPTTLEVNEKLAFFGTSDIHWHIEDTTEIFHAEIHDEDNTTEFIINAVNESHAYHSAGVHIGDVVGWTFNEGSNGTQTAISSIADNSGGTILVTTGTSHGLTIGDVICHTALTDAAYIGFFTVLTVPTTTTYTVTATFGVTRTGFMSIPSYVQIKDIAIGKYWISWTATVSAVGTGVTFDFSLHDGVNSIHGSKARHRIANASSFKMISGQALRNVINGDRIFFVLSNITDATNILIRNFSLITVKL